MKSFSNLRAAAAEQWRCSDDSIWLASAFSVGQFIKHMVCMYKDMESKEGLWRNIGWAQHSVLSTQHSDQCQYPKVFKVPMAMRPDSEGGREDDKSIKEIHVALFYRLKVSANRSYLCQTWLWNLKAARCFRVPNTRSDMQGTCTHRRDINQYMILIWASINILYSSA